jgi:tetratricopeptide (TPR) repeat protein
MYKFTDKEADMGKTLRVPLLFFFFITYLGSPGFGQQQELAEILKGCNQTVVTIIAYDAKNKEICQGKGVIVSPEGLVLTNYHLISQANSAKARLAAGKIQKKVDISEMFSLRPPGAEKAGAGPEKKAKGKMVDVEGVVSFDKNLDFALLKIKSKGNPAASLSSSAELKLGDKALVVVDDEIISETSITGVKNISKTKIAAQINLSLPPEMSGSPLFNDQAQVIGFASCLTESHFIILPASYALPLIKEGEVTSLQNLADEDYFSSSEGLYLKGLVYSILENYGNALNLLEESLRKNPNQLDAHSQLGYLHSKLGQFDKAVEAYEKAISIDPSNYRDSFGLAMAYIKLDQPQKAAAPLVQCTQQNPDFPDAFYNLGLVYEALGILDKAADAYQNFIKINPGPAWTGYSQLGSVYNKLGQYDKAIAAFQEVIKSNPSDLKANYNLAYAYDMSSEFSQAAMIYKKLIGLNPDDAKTYYGRLFLLYDKAGDYANAIETCKILISQAPDNHENLFNLGIIYLKKRDYQNALESFQKALTLKPNFDKAYYNIGLVYYSQEKFAEAADAFNKFIQLMPDQPEAHYNLGASYLHLKKYEEAIKPLERACELRPNWAQAHYNLGIAYYAVKDRLSANEEYNKLKTLDSALAAQLYKIINK